MEVKIEGITIKSTPFKENSRIITLFSPQKGLLSLIVKNLSIKKPLFLTLSSPFCLGEFVFQESLHGISKLKDGKVINPFLSIREHLESIQKAQKLSRIIERFATNTSQDSFPLFLLFNSYLSQIGKNPNSSSLLTSFLLKLLLLEGVLHLNSKCNLCEKKSISISDGESLCGDHAHSYGFDFSEEDFSLLIKIAYAKNFTTLHECTIPLVLEEKVTKLFEILL